MNEKKWTAFPYQQDEYNYAGEALKAKWERLHLGDKEPYPSPDYLRDLCESNPKVKASIPGFNGNYPELAEKLQEAWRLYHRGDFQQATKLGLSLGLPGYCVANKAEGMYAYFLEADETIKRGLLNDVVTRAEQAIAAMPKHANSHYLHAYALGRYSQSISIVKALSQGLGGKVKASLDQALILEPNHAEAHSASGSYHGEIIDKVGSFVAGLTYGAKKEPAFEHYQKALSITPDAPIAHIEYANGLLMIHGKKKIGEATKEYKIAAKLQPMDAMERLDVEEAKSQLE